MNILRTLTPLEKPRPWLLIGGAACGLMLLWVLLVAVEVIPDPYGSDIRGYTLTGIVLGVVVVVLSVVVSAYSLRKRALQERLRGGGTMMTWLWMHVTLGCVALVATVLHAGTGVFSFNLSTGKLVLLPFLGVMLSGIVWRLVYRDLPAKAAPEIGNYSTAGSSERAAKRLLEIEKLSAGKSEPFRRLGEWVVEALPSQEELWSRAGQLPAEEREAMQRLHELALSRGRALVRASAQQRYTRKLQRWRLLHVPLALSVPALLLVHVVAVLQPARALPLGTLPWDSGLVAPSSDCKDCHAAHYEQWRHSMHNRGLTSPVMVAQFNQIMKEELAELGHPDPKMLCANCHAPLSTALAGYPEELPFRRLGYSDALLDEGVGCVTCHQYRGETEPESGRAAFTSILGEYDFSGPTYYGPIADPVANAYHQSKPSELFTDRPDELCVNCHNVVLDLNEDGRIQKGKDLVLQRTTEEYRFYRRQGGKERCFSCHMPVVNETRAAEAATLPFEQSTTAPDRVVHDHSFVGVDYPLDTVADDDHHKGQREELLAQAANLEASIEGEALVTTITSIGAGHDLPTGFAFARQMWLEVVFLDATGGVLKASGKLARQSDDLCDANTLDHPVGNMARHVKGCAASDPELVNFQQQIVSRVELARDEAGEPIKAPPREGFDDFVIVASEGSSETAIQRVKGGVVPRRRPSDGQLMLPLQPNQSQSFRYAIPPGSARVTVRLLFRNLPPYWLRALAAGQPADEEPQLLPLVDNLLVTEMRKLEIGG